MNGSGRRFATAALLFLLLPCGIFAQDSTAVSQNGKHKKRFDISFHNDTLTPYGKNELAFNMAPFVSTLLGGFPDYQFRLSLFYKKQMQSPRNHMRFGLTYCPTVNNPFFADKPDDLYFVTGDSTRIRSSVSDNGRKPVQFNFGFERRGGNFRKLSGYYAVDLLYGAYLRNYYLYNYYERQDENNEWSYDDRIETDRVILNDSRKTFNWYAGVSVNAGLRYALTSRFFLTAQIGFEATYGQMTVYKSNRWGDTLYGNTYSSADFSTNALINEFALAYRF